MVFFSPLATIGRFAFELACSARRECVVISMHFDYTIKPTHSKRTARKKIQFHFRFRLDHCNWALHSNTVLKHLLKVKMRVPTRLSIVYRAGCILRYFSIRANFWPRPYRRIFISTIASESPANEGCRATNDHYESFSLELWLTLTLARHSTHKNTHTQCTLDLIFTQECALNFICAFFGWVEYSLRAVVLLQSLEQFRILFPAYGSACRFSSHWMLWKWRRFCRRRKKKRAIFAFRIEWTTFSFS